MVTVTRANARNFQRPLNRLQPKGPVQAYKTYEVDAPLATHWRTASCEQVGCLNQHYGFRTEVDTDTELGKRQAYYIVNDGSRSHKIVDDGRPGIVIFEFPPGTECFSVHKVRVSRPPLYIVRNGDWRKHLGGQRQHSSADSWVDDFASHQDRLAGQIGR